MLTYGVQIACAVETAHRAGILHRDIKPANILVSRVGIPALTDFGIAATLAEIGEDDEDAGLSVPWSPPEVLRSARASDARSDVWSLGATLYTLLSGRSPFEAPGGPNDMTSLMRRIEGESPLPLDRPDVPPSLERLLLQTMAKRPAARPPSALAFAQALQAIETELGLPVTSLVVMQHAATGSASASSSGRPATSRPSPAEYPDDGNATRMRAPGQVLPQPPMARPAARPRVAEPPEDRTISRDQPVDDRTIGRDQPVDDRTIGRDQPVDDRTIGRDDGSTRARETGLPRVVGPAGDDATRRRDGDLPGVRNVDPDQMSGVRWERSPRPGGIPTMDSTVVREHDPELLPERAGSLRARIIWVSVAAAALLVIGIAAVLSLSGGGGGEVTPTSTTNGSDPVTSPADALISKPTAVQQLAVRADAAGVVTVTWVNPDPQDGDAYYWKRVDPGAPSGRTDYVKTTTLQAGKLPAGSKPCFEIQVARGGQLSEASTACLS